MMKLEDTVAVVTGGRRDLRLVAVKIEFTYSNPSSTAAPSTRCMPLPSETIAKACHRLLNWAQSW